MAKSHQNRCMKTITASSFRTSTHRPPTHVLIIPRAKDIPRLADADESHQALLGHLLLVAGKVSKHLGVDDAFRLVINNGAAAGQTRVPPAFAYNRQQSLR